MVVLCLLCGPSRTAVAAERPPNIDVPAMESIFGEGLDSNGAPGGAISVVGPDRVVASTGFGETGSSGAEVTPPDAVPPRINQQGVHRDGSHAAGGGRTG
jgi:hypothetical protein